MITLEFKDKLTMNKFTYNNDFIYGEIKGLNVHYRDSEEEKPFIMRGHDSLYKEGELVYSDYGNQLRGRSLTTNRIKEILDSSRIPLKFRIGAQIYLIGKGFLAHFSPDSDLDVLFLAVAPKKVSYIDDVKFVISRNVYNTIHKRIQPVIKDFMTLHPGEILITSNLQRFVGSKINYPKFARMSDMAVYKVRLMDYCITEYAKSLPKLIVKLKPEDPVKVKKKKEAEILAALRSPLDPTPEVLGLAAEISANMSSAAAAVPTVTGAVQASDLDIFVDEDFDEDGDEYSDEEEEGDTIPY